MSDWPVSSPERKFNKVSVSLIALVPWLTYHKVNSESLSPVAGHVVPQLKGAKLHSLAQRWSFQHSCLSKQVITVVHQHEVAAAGVGGVVCVGGGGACSRLHIVPLETA